jgi:hypothetical protein
MRPTEAAVFRLVEAFPELFSDLQEHLAQDGELLEFIFLADVERWAERTWRLDATRVAALLSWLDEEYTQGDRKIQEWIAVGFVEVLPRPGEPAAALRLMLGPSLAALAKELG